MLSYFLAAGQQLSVAVRDAVAELDDDLLYCLQEQRSTTQPSPPARPSKSRDQATSTSPTAGIHHRQGRRQYNNSSAQRRSHSVRPHSGSKRLTTRDYKMEKLFGQLVEPQYIAGRADSGEQLQVNEATIELVQLIVQHPEIYKESTARMSALSSFPFQLNSQQSSFCSSLLLVCPSLLKLRYRLQAEDSIFFRTLLVLLGNMLVKPRVVAAICEAQLSAIAEEQDSTVDDIFSDISSLNLQWQATVGTSTDDVATRDSTSQAGFECDWDGSVDASTQTDCAPTQQRAAATQTTVSYLQKRVSFDVSTSTRAESQTQTHNHQAAQTEDADRKPTTAFGAFKSFLQRVERVLGEVKQPASHSRSRSTIPVTAVAPAPSAATRQRSASVDASSGAKQVLSSKISGHKRVRANTTVTAPINFRRRFAEIGTETVAHDAIHSSVKAIDDAFSICGEIVRELIDSMSDNKAATENDIVVPTGVTGGKPVATADDVDEFDESSALLYSTKHFGSSSAEYQPLVEMFYSGDSDSDSDNELEDEVDHHSATSVSEINVDIDFSDDDFEFVHNSQVDQRI